MKPDAVTRRWTKDASDEYAISQGCWFDEERGQFVVDWMHDYLYLYEGECAGQPFVCKDWQYDATMRIYGWVVNDEDWKRVVRRFRQVSIFVAKKNKKSPTLAAWACYIAMGDGVMGQKVFPTAKDGNQIRENVGRHIFEMIRQSEELARECTLNRNMMSVFHEPTRSLIMPLSSDNVRTQKSKEGLNGSIIVDETHVVDSAHMRRLSRAGISRPEPLQIEASTAGDDPNSYGFRRFRYAQAIARGDVKDTRTLAILHCAPQDVSDADLLADPLKYAKMANPAMGHTVMPGELLHDVEVSKANPGDWADCKKYRFNIWQSSSTPWIDINHWNACNATDGESDVGSTLFAGLDLSRTTDVTAWVLFDPERQKCWGHYWVPEDRVDHLCSQYEYDFHAWADEGWLTICRGRLVDREQVHARIEEDCGRFFIAGCGYDRYNADDTVKFCENQLSLQMVVVRQTMTDLAAPTKRMKELITSGQLDHSNDPVLKWMLSNTDRISDNNGNERPVKTSGGDRKHCDGIVALIMAEFVSNAEGFGALEYQRGDIFG